MLVHFSNLHGLFDGNEGGFFLRKKPLECLVSVYSNSENAITAARNIFLVMNIKIDPAMRRMGEGTWLYIHRL
jgi:hypothetical protein